MWLRKAKNIRENSHIIRGMEQPLHSLEMILCTVLAALAVLGLGEAQPLTRAKAKFHVPLVHKVVSGGPPLYRVRNGHLEPAGFKEAFLVGNITVGTPPQPLEVLFDLGSSEMIIPSANSPDNKAICKKYPCFDELSSSTFIDTHVFSKESYGAGKDFGWIALDVVEVGGLRVSNHTFLNVIIMDGGETDRSFTAFHGIIGMSPREREDLLERYGPPFIYNAQAQGLIKEKVFAILYPTNNENGQLTIGGYNESLVLKDQITWFDNAVIAMEPNHFWGFVQFSVSAEIDEDDKAFGSPRMLEKVIADSGSPVFMYLPYPVFSALNDVFKKCGYDLATDPFAPISVLNELPTLTFEIAGRKYPFEPSQYIMTHDDSPLTIPVGMFTVKISSFPVPLVGGLFLRNFYSIYDMENARIGLVPVADINQ